MILQSLYDYYRILLDDPECEIAPPMYSPAKVSFSLILSYGGELLDIMDLRISSGKKAVPRTLIVPEQPKRTSGISPFFLCDNTGYVLGMEDKKGMEKFNAFRSFQQKILNRCTSPEALAVLAFLDRWGSAGSTEHPVIKRWSESLAGSNVVFQLDGSFSYIHTAADIKAAWEKHCSGKAAEYETSCLVTGKTSPVAKIHPNIKGVTGAQTSGAALVSFNIPSFRSFGKEQSYNAPVGEDAAFGYATALNYLLADRKHRLPIVDTTTVFWAEKPGGIEENLFSLLLNPPLYEDTGSNDGSTSDAKSDPETDLLLKDSIKRISLGLPLRDWTDRIDAGVRFFVLGLSPNNARIAVRFWHVDTLDGFAAKIGQHYADLRIEGLRNHALPVWMLLKETAVQRDLKNVSPVLEGSLMRAILTGEPYPQTLYVSILTRIRADHEVNGVRAAILRACLLRKARKYSNNKNIHEEVISMSLNLTHGESASELGRLFAVLEKIQQNANPGINSTIKDRYFNSASTTPVSVFPRLMKLSNHHLAKLEDKNRIYWENQITGIVSEITHFPARLNLEEQGLFVLGYYHQREKIYSKKQEKEGAE